MLLDQLTRFQKFQFLMLASFVAVTAFYIPLAMAFGLSFLPAVLMEIAVLGLHVYLNKKKLIVSDMPWLLLLYPLSLTFNLPSFLMLAGLAHPQIYSKLWEKTLWLPQRVQIVTLASSLLLLTHIISCGWLYLQAAPMNDPVDKYVWGIYWTVTTLATVGYGDIIPQSTLARFYAMGIMMLGVSGFAIFVSHFSRLLMNRDARLQTRNAKLRQLHDMMTHYQVPLKVRNEAFTLYDHILGHKHIDEEEQILAELPVGMRESLHIHMRVFAISKIELFKGLEQNCLEMIASQFEEKFYNTGDVIVSQGEVGHEMFVVHHGDVEVLRDGHKITTLTKGKVFGEMALIGETTRNAQVIAKKYCHILILNDDAYKKIIARFPQFRLRLESIHQQRKVG